jgi:hypothetical protein
MEDLWHEEAKRNIPLSKSGKPMTSRRVMKNGVSSEEAERRAWATVNKSDRGGREKAEEAAGKSEVIKFPQRVEEKVVEVRAAQSIRRSSAGRCLHGW